VALRDHVTVLVRVDAELTERIHRSRCDSRVVNLPAAEKFCRIQTGCRTTPTHQRMTRRPTLAGEPPIGMHDTTALIAVLGCLAGAVWLVVAHRRVRAVEQQWLAEHPSVPEQPPAS